LVDRTPEIQTTTDNPADQGIGTEQPASIPLQASRRPSRNSVDIDETIAAIGAIYSQLQIIGARDIDSSRAKRLSTDVAEQASRLDDLLSAMDEVYGSSRSG
jgi:hypothetical protein